MRARASLFAVFDLKSRKLTGSFETGVAAGGRLAEGPDGKLYLAAEGQLLRIDPAARSCENVASYPELGEFVSFAGGYLYGFADTHLLRLKVQ